MRPKRFAYLVVAIALAATTHSPAAADVSAKRPPTPSPTGNRNERRGPSAQACQAASGLARLPGTASEAANSCADESWLSTTIDCFTPELQARFASDDRQLVGLGEKWGTENCRLTPPKASFYEGGYCPMFEQVMDQRDLRNARIEVSFLTGDGPVTHPGILFRGRDTGNFGYLYVRPHYNGSSFAVVLSSAVSGFWGPVYGGPHFEQLAGAVADVGFGRQVDLVLEIVNDWLSLDINGVRRISNFDIAGAGYFPSGKSGVAICDNRDPSTAFLRFTVTPLP